MKNTNYINKARSLEKENFNIAKLYIAYELECHDEKLATDEMVEQVYSLWLEWQNIEIAEISRNVVSVVKNNFFKGSCEKFIKYCNNNRDEICTELESIFCGQ